MHRPNDPIRATERSHPALVWARLFAVTLVAVIGTYLLVVGVLATAVAWGWTA